jgi:hypothetical protein
MVKVKLSLCSTKHHAMGDVLGEWKYSSTHSLTSALEGGEWLASRPGRFTPRERAPCTHWIGGCVRHLMPSQKFHLVSRWRIRSFRNCDNVDVSFTLPGLHYVVLSSASSHNQASYLKLCAPNFDVPVSPTISDDLTAKI